MDHNAPALDGGAGVGTVCRAELVVINNRSGCGVPNLDPELVNATAAVDLPINRRKQETVVASVVDPSGALVLAIREVGYGLAFISR